MATPDDIVTLAALQARFPDNTSGDITAEDMRDTMTDLYNSIVAALWKFGNQVTLTGLETELITTIGAAATMVKIDLRDISINSIDWITMQLGGAGGYVTDPAAYVGRSRTQNGIYLDWNAEGKAGVNYQAQAADEVTGQIVMLREPGTNRWNIYVTNQEAAANGQPNLSHGVVDMDTEVLTSIRLNTQDETDSFDNGTAQVSWQ